MKTKLLLVILLLTGLQFFSFGQNEDICSNLYVWPFTDPSGEQTMDSRMLTDEVEEALTQVSDCVILQRRNYAHLATQLENEKGVQSLNDLPQTIDQELQTIKAQTVLFGNINKDFTGNIILQVSFQSLESKQIRLQNSIVLTGEEAQNISRRKQKIQQFITACVKPSSFLEERDWEEAQRVDTKAAYIAFLDTYPNSELRSVIDRILADEDAWAAIQQKGIRAGDKIKLLEAYRKRPKARHKEAADGLLETELWENDKYKKLVKLFPEGTYTPQAKEILKKRADDRKSLFGTISDVSTTILGGTGGAASDTYTVTFHIGKRATSVTIADESFTPKFLDSKKNVLVVSLPAGNHEISLFSKEGLMCRKKFCVNGDQTISAPCNVLPDAVTGQQYKLKVIVGSKVEKVVVGGNRLTLKKRSDGKKEGSIRLVSGTHPMKIYKEGKVLCSKSVKVKKSWTVNSPCSRYKGKSVIGN